ncbi:zinc-binding dehydrogenase [Metasolibacillus meyeri]|uniref:Zinc-binding dehydrogenase n=1 Tax=Metasolibacillus meyeri TaxID=1071052 RepID=A0AAW9NQ10_9BACL|nr:zinc-binding dehydrogenase [Metasolibacillus meyeri]MEC1177809.1 zinc-binding dehydrogenase [Metasolibacillus meyeri]
MKKIIINEFGEPAVLQYVEVDKPTIGDSEVLIQVKNFSINYADIKNRKGGKAKANFPMSLGLDLAGVVVEVGQSVTHIEVGDRVAAFAKDGAYAEYAVANGKLVFKLPEEVSFEQGAASLTVTFLSYILTNKLVDISKNAFVIVHAASGGVGTTLLQLLKIKGVENIIAVTSSESKFALLKGYGAKYTFTYDDFSQGALDVTNGEGVDIVFDSVAGDVTKQSLVCLKEYGTLLQFGNSSGEVATFTNLDVHASCRNIMGFSLGTTRKLRPEYIQSLSKEVFALIQQQQIKTHIEHVFDFDSIIEAHELMESRMHSGKILVAVEL